MARADHVGAGWGSVARLADDFNTCSDRDELASCAQRIECPPRIHLMPLSLMSPPYLSDRVPVAAALGYQQLR
jgi:hypothetical protein